MREEQSKGWNGGGKRSERKVMERWRRKEKKIGARVGGTGEEEDAQNEEW